MSGEKEHVAASIVLRYSIVGSLLFLVLTALFLFAEPSFSKYVLNSTYYPVWIQSSETLDITGIGEISGTAQVGQPLTAGELTPAGATATYQWQKSVTEADAYTAIPGATSSTYTPVAADYNFYIKVAATGTGSYTGIVTSACTGPVAAAPTTPITAIGAIGGTAQMGQTITAGALTPADATATYQWQRSADNVTYADINGATSSTYTLGTDDYNCYLKVAATGSDAYSDTVTSAAAGPVGMGQITAIGDISGTTVAGQILTAGTLTPLGATVTYQWQKSFWLEGGNWSDISGATSSTYTVAVNESLTGAYLRVVATGTGAYQGTAASNYTGPVVKNTTPITAIGAIIGTPQVGQTLTAGAITPTGATATYQWQRSADNVAYADINGATSGTYTLDTDDYTRYIRVVATGTGSYSGTVTSVHTGPAAADQITAIGAITGTTQIGHTVTAGELTPAGATVTYQWQRCDASNGTYTDISGATSSIYTLTAGDLNNFIKVAATGTGSYTGMVTSAYTGPVVTSVIPVTAIGAISGTAQAGQTLTAGTLTPAGATVTYQWQRSANNVTYVDINGATSSTYTLGMDDYTRYIRVAATGTGSYSGTATSAATGLVGIGQIMAIGDISGTTVAGQILTAGTLTPSGATVTYQWQKCFWLPGGNWNNISGATSSTYIVAVDQSLTGAYIRVVATGTGAYQGTATSAATGPVVNNATPITAIGAISGTAEVGQTLAAGAITPTGATVTYQWQRSADNVTYADISGATSGTYTLGADDYTRYIRVVATGTGSYSGMVTSAYTGPCISSTTTPITAIGVIGGTAQVGQILTAGALTPAGATATYQWQKSTAAGGVYAAIPGATSSTYTPVADDYNCFLKVVATGTGSYSGTVSAYTSQVAAAPINILAITGVTVPVTGNKPVTTIAATSQYTATISWSPSANKFSRNIIYTATSTITAKTGYTLTGVSANSFTVAGATSVANAANSGLVTAVFPITT